MSTIGACPSGVTVISQDPSNCGADPPPLAFDCVPVKAMRVASIVATTRVASVLLIVMMFLLLVFLSVE
jgi:hypothetical protein